MPNDRVHETIEEPVTMFIERWRQDSRSREKRTVKDKSKTKGSISKRKENIKPGTQLLVAAL